MRLSRIILAAVAMLVAGAVTASAMSFSTRSSASHGGWPSGCPRHPVREPGWTPLDLARAAKAVHAQVHRVFGNLTSQGHAAWHDALVSALVATSGTGYGPGGSPPPLKGTHHYQQAAIHACGRTTASASLVAFIYFPYCQLACSYNFAYITKTRRGWYLWTSYQV
jgi:hypothetical protein